MALSTIPGLRGEPRWPQTINTPVAIVGLQNGEFDQSFGDAATLHTLTITLLLSLTALRSAQTQLDDYLAVSGEKSIWALFNVNTNLGGLVDWIRVIRYHSVDTMAANGTDFAGAIFDVEVMS